MVTSIFVSSKFVDVYIKTEYREYYNRISRIDPWLTESTIAFEHELLYLLYCNY